MFVDSGNQAFVDLVSRPLEVKRTTEKCLIAIAPPCPVTLCVKYGTLRVINEYSLERSIRRRFVRSSDSFVW